MTRELKSLLLLPLLAAAASAQDKPAQEGEPAPLVFPAEVELVMVDTVVLDKKQKAPLAGLTRSDFTITEDGAVQEIVSFEEVRLPETPSDTPPPKPRVSTNVVTSGAFTGRTFVVVFDDVHLTPFQAHRAKIAVAEFLKKGVREGDRVSLLSSGGDAWWTTRMEAGREELLTLLKRLEGRHIPDRSPERITDNEAMRIHVYNDAQVVARVARRFETYGAVPTTGRRDEGLDIGQGPVQGRAAEVYYQATARNRITLEVMERILVSLDATKGRKSLILVSEGFIWDPNLDEFKRVVQAARRSNCAVYFLDTRGLGGLPAQLGAEFGPPIDTQDLGAAFIEHLDESAGAETIADETGGFTVKNTNDLTKGIQRIADESRSYYLIGYHPTNAKMDGRFRKISVKVSRKGTEVRARKGYYAPLGPGMVARDTKSKKRVDPEFQSALDSPFEMDEIPMRMTAYVFEETLLGRARALIAADVDVREFAFEESEGRFRDSLEFLLIAAHRETGEFFRYDQTVEMKLLPATRERLGQTWFPIVREFELAPGGYQAKLVVRDKNRGTIGTVVHEFEVPELTQLRTSTPVLSDGLQPGDEDPKSSRPTLLARRSFAPGSTLFCQFEVYGAAKDKASGMPQVSAGLEIRRKDGTVVTRAEPTTIIPTSLGRLSRLVGTPLEGTEPGEYELVLTVRDELAGKSVAHREPFTVTTESKVAAAGGE